MTVAENNPVKLQLGDRNTRREQVPKSDATLLLVVAGTRPELFSQPLSPTRIRRYYRVAVQRAFSSLPAVEVSRLADQFAAANFPEKIARRKPRSLKTQATPKHRQKVRLT